MALSKSLMELDKLADEILAKSMRKSDDDDDLQPSDISDDDSVEVDDSDTTDEDTDDTDEEETKKSTRKSMRKSTRKSMRKSDDTDDDYDEDDDEDEDDSQYAKCVDDDDVTKSDTSINDTSSIDDTDSEGEDDELSHAKVAKSARKSMRKSDDDDDDDSDDYDDEDVADDFKDDPEVSKAIHSSRFYAALTDILAKSLSDLQLDVRSQGRDSNNSSAILAKSLQASIAMNEQLRATNNRLARRVTKLEKSMHRDTERIMEALDEIASQPAGMRKSVRSVSIHDRNFAKSLGDSQPEGFDALNKSQVMSILENELYSGNQAVTAQDIIGYESGAPLSDSLKSLVVSKA